MRPGIRASDLAREAGVSRPYVTTVLKQLEADNKLRRADGGLLAP